MRLAVTALFATSLFTFVIGSPLFDMSPNVAQLMLGSHDSVDPPDQCKPEGTLCDWPAGSRGPCCEPLLCVPLSAHRSPYLICARQ